MKKVIFGLLSLTTLTLTLFSCSKQDEPVATPAQETAIAPPTQLDGTTARQTITMAQLSGKYQLKYDSTASDRTWKPTTTVGLSMFPNTFLYSVGKFNFNPSTSKVAMSSISSIPTLPDVQFGSNFYKVSGDDLTISQSNTSAPGDALLKVYSLSGSWLILLDKRTQIAWAFYRI
jgi:hypothetical protein